MRRRHLVLVLASALSMLAANADVHYFKNVRDVQVKQPGEQSYVVIDPEIWAHTRQDLGDIRLFSATTEVPYALQVEGGDSYSAPRPLKILNLGAARGATSFVLDMSGVPEYDEITLDVVRHDFVTRATVEGADDPAPANWVTLASGALFDYSREKLGSNSTVKVPRSTFRYLRIVIPAELEPKDIQGASGADTSRVEAVWDDIPVQFKSEEKDHHTIITFELPHGVPANRLRFAVPEDRINFRRAVQVEIMPEDMGTASRPVDVISRDISRVRVRQGNHTEICENLELPIYDGRDPHWRVTVDNGDDAPLPLSIKVQTLQRRLYFNPHGATSFKLYYGDEKLTAPVYDYAKFFNPRETKGAVSATLGAGEHNAAYTGRPDERPWTERHGWVLWAAMAVAILGVGALALRGLKPLNSQV